MAELQIHHEVEVEQDPLGLRVGVQASIIAVVLAVITILSHRAHTDAVLLKAAANDTQTPGCFGNWASLPSFR